MSDNDVCPTCGIAREHDGPHYRKALKQAGKPMCPDPFHDPDEREPRHSCPYGCEGDCDVPEHLRGQRDYFARVAELAQEQLDRLLNHQSGDRRGFDILRSILAAWDEGVGIPDPAQSQSPTRFVAVWMSEGEAQHCLDLLRESAGNPDIEWPERVVSLFERAVEGEPRRTFEQMQAEREIAHKLTDPLGERETHDEHD